MIADGSSPNSADIEMSYAAAVAILEEMAAGVSVAPDLRALTDAAGAAGHDGTDTHPLEPAPVADVTQQWSRSAFHSVIESLPDAIVVVDGDGHIRLVNEQTEKLFGYRRAEMYGWPIELLVPVKLRAGHVAQRNSYLANPHVRPMGANLDLYGRRKNGSEFPVEISLSPIETENGTLVASTIRDTTQKKQAEAQLQSAEARYRTLVEEIPAVTFMASLDGGVQELYVSPQIQQLLGFTQKQWLEDPVLWYTQLHPEDQDRWHRDFAQTCARGKHFLSEYRFIAKDGAIVWVHGEAKMVRDELGQPLFLQGVAFDITDRKNAEETLRRANDELERQVAEALEEVHHRVKNNLGLIGSMHRTQARALNDPKLTPIFTEMGHRLKSIAEIHELLYKSGDLSRVDFRRYVDQLGLKLVRAFRPDVQLKIQIQDVFFGLRTAVPCGLMITELVSNCLKYAFPDEPGEIVVSLRPQGERFLLTVRDDGVGFPEDLHIHNTESLGMKIVTSQAKQLKGEIKLTRSPGTTFQITFAEKKEREPR